MSEKGLQIEDDIWRFGSFISNELVIWKVDKFISHKIREGDLSIKLFSLFYWKFEHSEIWNTMRNEDLWHAQSATELTIPRHGSSHDHMMEIATNCRTCKQLHIPCITS
jgi:hypothetical protein